MLPAVKWLATWLNVLALLVALLGAVAFYFVHQALSPPELLETALELLLPTLLRPSVLAAGLVAIAATVAVRYYELRPPAKERSRSHEVKAEQIAASPIHAEAGPWAPSRHGHELLRLRLQEHLSRDGDVVGFINELLAGGVASRASDIHIQPLAGTTRISLRAGGSLEEVAAIADVHHERIIRRLKVMSGLQPYRTDEPQDGRFSLDTPNGAVEVRISVLPTQYGGKAVMRLAQGSAELRGLGSLGMGAELLRDYEELLAEPQGLVLLTGPTGSGKTTTIYASLAQIHEERGHNTNIASIEDPVEVNLPFVSQTQVNRDRGLDFAKGLRAVLRQDPNVLMIGEIRDPETAEIAVQAGLTGHLILSTLHAESTAGVFARLIDVGTEPFLVASSTLACVSQRLLPRLCPGCRRRVKTPRSVRSELSRRGLDADGDFYRADGCSTCKDTGVLGRTAVYELLRLTSSLRKLVASKVPTAEIEAAAREEGNTPIAAAAVAVAAAGEVAVKDVLRVLR